MPELYDFVVIGSGIAGSVSAIRLAEKSYCVLMLERGKRFILSLTITALAEYAMSHITLEDSRRSAPVLSSQYEPSAIASD